MSHWIREYWFQWNACHWPVGELGVAVTPVEVGRRFLNVWTWLFTVLFTHWNKASQSGDWEEACSSLSVHQKDFFTQQFLSGMFWPWGPMTSPFPRAKENGSDSSFIQGLIDIDYCYCLNVCWAKTLALQLHPIVGWRGENGWDRIYRDNWHFHNPT